MPKKVCKYHGCKATCPRSEKYCDEHREQGQSEEYKKDRHYPCRSYQYLYNSERWRKKRLHQLIKEPLCQDCLNRGKEELALIADHVIDHKGDPYLFWSGKLQSLCPSCHAQKTNRSK